MLYGARDSSARAKKTEALGVVFAPMSGMPVRDVLATQETRDNKSLVCLEWIAGAGGPEGMRSCEADKLWLEVMERKSVRCIKFVVSSPVINHSVLH